MISDTLNTLPFFWVKFKNLTGEFSHMRGCHPYQFLTLDCLKIIQVIERSSVYIGMLGKDGVHTKKAYTAYVVREI